MFGVAGKAESEGERRMPAISSDDDARRNRPAVVDDHAVHRDAADARNRVRALDCRARLEFGAGPCRLLQERPVQFAPDQRPTLQAMRVGRFDNDTVRPCQDHAGDRQAACLEAIGQAEPPEQRERAGVDRVAAQFVAGKTRAIDDAHASAVPSEHGCGNGARRPRADDQDIKHLVI